MIKKLKALLGMDRTIETAIAEYSTYLQTLDKMVVPGKYLTDQAKHSN